MHREPRSGRDAPEGKPNRVPVAVAGQVAHWAKPQEYTTSHKMTVATEITLNGSPTTPDRLIRTRTTSSATIGNQDR
jgi:hypothetical protein